MKCNRIVHISVHECLAKTLVLVWRVTEGAGANDWDTVLPPGHPRVLLSVTTVTSEVVRKILAGAPSQGVRAQGPRVP